MTIPLGMEAQAPRPGQHVRLTGPSGREYHGVLGMSGSAGIELYRDGRETPCIFPAASTVEVDETALDG